MTGQGIPQKDLNKVLSFLQLHPSEESDECYSIVLKMGLSLSAKKKERAIAQKEQILKFTKKEIDSMPEPIRILLLYGEYEIKYAVYNNSYHASVGNKYFVLPFLYYLAYTGGNVNA